MFLSAVSSVVQTLSNLLVEEATILGGVANKVEELLTEMRLMASFLKEADKRRHEDDQVRNWVSEIQEVAYDAEDVIEHYTLKVRSRKQDGVLKRYATKPKDLLLMRKVESEIDEMKSKISSLTKSLQTHGIKATSEEERRRQQQQRTTYSHLKEDVIVGLDSDIEMLVSQLVDEKKHYQVVSIWGAGGLGKTTLARKVYTHQIVKRHFDAFAWAYISQECNKKDILEGILTQLISPSDDDERRRISRLKEDELTKQLYQVQEQKKCLVILDGIWDIGTWRLVLKPAFPIGHKASGSKILLTTHKRDVPLRIDSQGFHHQLHCLNEKDSWELFQTKAFRDRQSNSGFDQDNAVKVEELARAMVEKCNGLPLAIIVLGGLVATKNTLEEWQSVHEHVMSNLKLEGAINQEDLEDHEHTKVEKLLALSYEELPYPLKPCFLYLCHYLEDEEIQTRRLIQMWMAEGFLGKDDNGQETTMEDVGEFYLQELIDRCLVQVGKISSTRRVKSCRLHAFVRELCYKISKKDYFFEVVKLEHGSEARNSSIISSKRSRRLKISCDSDDGIRQFISSTYGENSHLRTLLVPSPEYNLNKFFKKMRFIRVLDVTDVYGRGLHSKPLPRGIKHMINLRFLCIKLSFQGLWPWTLSSHIGDFENLQTLDLRQAFLSFEVGRTWVWGFTVPDVISKMKHLRHLYLHQESNGQLRLGVANYNNLQTLVNFPLHVCNIDDVIKLIKLRKLVLREGGKSFRDWIDNFDPGSQGFKFDRLQSLSLISTSDDTVNLKWLLPICPLLNKLIIHAKLKDLPSDHQYFPPNLTKLVLKGCKLMQDPMETLQKLPKLRILVLEQDSFIGEKMVCSKDGFPELECLELQWLPHLNNWRVEEGAMPNLQRLLIWSQKLKSLPDGLRFLINLQDLNIARMPSKFKARTDPMGEDFQKVKHVLSIIK